jgi:hypothetical protein
MPYARWQIPHAQETETEADEKAPPPRGSRGVACGGGGLEPFFFFENRKPGSWSLVRPR